MRKLAITMIMIVFVFASCQRGEREAAGDTVALVLKTLNNPFFIDLEKAAQQMADELGVDLLVQAPEREVDVEKQMQIVENLIQRRVGVICIAPSGSKEIVPAILKANQAGIPVIAVDTRVDQQSLQEAGGHITAYIGSDNYEGGRLAAKHVAGLLGGEGKIAILEGIPGHETGDERLRGFRSVVDTMAAIEVVTSQTANWERDQGFTVFQNILQSHPDVDALFSCNDMMALGAVEAAVASGEAEEVVIMGFDAVADAKQAILDGTMHASVAQFPSEMGRLAVEYAHKLLAGEQIPEYIPVKIELITRETLLRRAAKK